MSFHISGLVTTPTLQKIFFAFGGLNLLFPILITKCLLDFYRNRKSTLLINRYSKIIILFLIGCIIQSCAISLTIICMPDPLGMGLIFVSVLFMISLIIVLGSMTIRFWLIRFDTKLAQIGLSKQWQILINSQSGENNWYVKYHHNLGNLKFLTQWVFSIYSILAMADLLIMIQGYVCMYVAIE